MKEKLLSLLIETAHLPYERQVDYLLANGVIVSCDADDYSKIPMQENDANAKTVGEYLQKLLLTLWDEEGEFSGKRPFGNSGWKYEIFAALISSGAVLGTLDECGYVEDVDYEAADNIVREIISREEAEKALEERKKK